MNRVISKLLLPNASRAVIFRTIYTKEYLGLAFRQKKQEEAHDKAGKNVMKIKENFMTKCLGRFIVSLVLQYYQNCFSEKPF